MLNYLKYLHIRYQLSDYNENVKAVKMNRYLIIFEYGGFARIVFNFASLKSTQTEAYQVRKEIWNSLHIK